MLRRVRTNLLGSSGLGTLGGIAALAGAAALLSACAETPRGAGQGGARVAAA